MRRPRVAVADRGDIMSEVWPAVRAVFEPILERDAANVRGSFDDLQRQVASACQMGHAPALSDAIMELFDSTTRRRVQRLSELRGGDALLSGTLEIATSHARACASVAVVLHQLDRFSASSSSRQSLHEALGETLVSAFSASHEVVLALLAAAMVAGPSVLSQRHLLDLCRRLAERFRIPFDELAGGGAVVAPPMSLADDHMSALAEQSIGEMEQASGFSPLKRARELQDDSGPQLESLCRATVKRLALEAAAHDDMNDY